MVNRCVFYRINREKGECGVSLYTLHSPLYTLHSPLYILHSPYLPDNNFASKISNRKPL